MIWHLPRPIKGLVIDVLTALPDVAPNKQLPGRDDAIDKYFPSTLESPKEISLPPPQIGGYTIEAPSPMSRQPQYAPGNDSGISSVEFAKKSPEEEFMPPANRIQMPLAQEGQARTKPGNWLRDSRWFWAQLLAKRPSLFSNENQKYIDKGLSPKVDPIWLKHHPEQETFIGDFLVHHHIDRGSEAAGVPRRFHQIFHGALHL